MNRQLGMMQMYVDDLAVPKDINIVHRIFSESISKSNFLFNLTLLFVALRIGSSIYINEDTFFPSRFGDFALYVPRPHLHSVAQSATTIQSRACSLPHAAAHCPVSVPRVYVLTIVCCSGTHHTHIHTRTGTYYSLK